MSARHLYSLPIVGGCALDPSAMRIAFVVTTLDEEANAYRGSLRIVNLHDGETRTITHGTARDGAPQWSADGKALFFLSDRGGTTQLWRVDLAGGDPQAMPAVPGNLSEFSVAPVGARVAVIATPTTQRETVERRGWRRITRLRYRADGPGFLDDLPQLWLIDVAGGTVRALTQGDGQVGSPSWDPAGETIAFTGEHDPRADSLWRRELWTAGATDDWQARCVSTFGSAIDVPAWSPDGKHIACCGIEELRSTGGLRNFQLFVIDRLGTSRRCLTRDEEWTCGNFVLSDIGVAGGFVHPVWTSSDEVAVLGSSRGSARIFAVRANAKPRPLTPHAASVTEFAMLDRESVVYCASNLATPPELYLSRGDEMRRLTHYTHAWCADMRIEPPAHFSIAAPGGEIDAWHLEGSGPTPRPCILQIHGGPHFAYGNAYVFEFMLLAAAGFDVVYCNPRGSQTYGEAFAAGIKANWARPALEDCMAVLDAALDRFAIDPKRLGVAGGSYGGYLTSFAIGQTTRFAAAIAMRPASNLFSLWGTSEVGRMLAEDFGGRPLDVPDVYRRDSPLTYADAIETPLLIIHSENDYRTPTEQSEQLFTALCERGASVEVLRFMNCDHNLSRSGPPQQRVTRLEAIIDWFERYLALHPER
ncbi:MAG: S9 family peptidase [Candidatus Eremiobacteraeota bacterium]|nr:S9 family peptidase [Candidatus Eremiobacteraeota bacterium]